MTPGSVAIVAMGLSHADYMLAALHSGGKRNVADEVWGINAIGGVLQCDRVFMMDRPSYLLSFPEGLDYQWMWTYQGPIYTSVSDMPELKWVEEYPLEDVLNCIRYPYLNTTVAYAVAYAIYLGVRSISLYGCDFTYPDNHAGESGRGCVEFLLGIAAERGIKIHVAGRSTLLDVGQPMKDRFYGYVDLQVDVVGGRFIVKKEQR